MARRCDAGKEAAWLKRLKRFGRSGLTVAQFCDGERVSVASFYYWRQKLGQTASRRRGKSRPGGFRQVAVVPIQPAMGAATPAVVPAPPDVIPAVRGVAPVASAKTPAASRIVIHFPCGTRVEVDAERLDAVRAVVGEVARAHDGVQTGIRSW
jgi:hypothetical protein